MINERIYEMNSDRDCRYYVDAIVTIAAMDEVPVYLVFENDPKNRWFKLKITLGENYFAGPKGTCTDWREPIRLILETPDGIFEYKSEDGCNQELLDFVIDHTMYLYTG